MFIYEKILSMISLPKWGGVVLFHNNFLNVNNLSAVPYNEAGPFILYDSYIFIVVVAALVSALSVSWIFKKVLRIAKIRGIVDNPDARKLQSAPVPVMGGIAVFFGLVSGLFTFYALSSIGSHPMVVKDSGVGVVILASAIMLYIGALDDIFDLSPLFRFAMQIIVVMGLIISNGLCIDSFHGLWGIEKIPGYISLPLTVFACVGIINAYNLIDGVNGLSSGLCMVLSWIIGVIFFKRFDFGNAAFAFCYATSLIPFYLHNVFGKESKMFIGDAGTMVMGLLVSWFAIRILASQSVAPVPESGREMCLVALMLAVASVPIADTLRVMFGRVISGKSPFSPDKTHLHHAFIAAGVSHFVTHLAEIAINLIVVAIWFLSYRSGLSQEMQLYLTVVSMGILVWGVYYFLHYQEKHETKAFVSFKKWSSLTYLGDREWWQKIQRMVDRL